MNRQELVKLIEQLLPARQYYADGNDTYAAHWDVSITLPMEFDDFAAEWRKENTSETAEAQLKLAQAAWSDRLVRRLEMSAIETMRYQIGVNRKDGYVMDGYRTLAPEVAAEFDLPAETTFQDVEFTLEGGGSKHLCLKRFEGYNLSEHSTKDFLAFLANDGEPKNDIYEREIVKPKPDYYTVEEWAERARNFQDEENEARADECVPVEWLNKFAAYLKECNRQFSSKAVEDEFFYRMHDEFDQWLSDFEQAAELKIKIERAAQGLRENLYDVREMIEIASMGNDDAASVEAAEIACAAYHRVQAEWRDIRTEGEKAFVAGKGIDACPYPYQRSQADNARRDAWLSGWHREKYARQEAA